MFYYFWYLSRSIQSSCLLKIYINIYCTFKEKLVKIKWSLLDLQINSFFFHVSLNDIVLNVDIAPTILGVAGVEIPEFMDGRNFMPLLREWVSGIHLKYI